MASDLDLVISGIDGFREDFKEFRRETKSDIDDLSSELCTVTGVVNTIVARSKLVWKVGGLIGAGVLAFASALLIMGAAVIVILAQVEGVNVKIGPFFKAIVSLAP